MAKAKVTMGVQLFGDPIRCAVCEKETEGFGVKTILLRCQHCGHVTDPARPVNKKPNSHAYAMYIDWCKQNNVPAAGIMDEKKFIDMMIPMLTDNKLQDGDYCTDLTDAQVYELLKLEGLSGMDNAVKLFGGSIVYEHGIFCPMNILNNKKNKLEFPEMRERAINTYRKTI